MYCRSHFIGRHTCSVSERYALEPKWLGSGGRAYVVPGASLLTGVIRAIKVASKAKAANDFGGPTFEVNMMAKLDHPNIGKLYETFEDEDHMYLVLELCAGGEMLDCATRWGIFAETDAQILMVQILRAVRYLHKCQARHGDLVPANILMLNQEPPEKNTVKVVDFGGVQKGEKAVDDIISCGSLMQALLSMVPHAYGKLRRKDSNSLGPPPVFNAAGIECNVSKKARDLLWKLKSEPGIGRKKLTAGQALGHEWLRRLAPQYSLEKVALPAELSDRISRFANFSVLKKAVLMILADKLDSEQALAVRQLFSWVDYNQDGFVSPYDLHKAMKTACIPPMQDAAQTLRKIDLDRFGAVDFTVFTAMCLDDKACLTDSALQLAFESFDPLRRGKVSRQQIWHALAKDQPKDGRTSEEIADALRSLEGGVDGMIDFAEFCRALRAEGDAPARSDAVVSGKRREGGNVPETAIPNGDRDTIREAKAELMVTENRRRKRDEERLARKAARRAKKRAKAARKKMEARAFVSFAGAVAGESTACLADLDDSDEPIEEEPCLESSGSGSEGVFSDVDAGASRHLRHPTSDDVPELRTQRTSSSLGTEDSTRLESIPIDSWSRAGQRPCQRVVVQM